MVDEWPPEGTSSPREYTKNTKYIYIIAVIISVLFFIAFFPELNEGIDTYLSAYFAFVKSHGVPADGVISRSGAVVGVIVIGILLRKFVIVPVHEGIHYAVDLYWGHNPDFGYREGYLLNNPRVAPLAKGISVGESLTALIAPFAVIGFTSWAVMYITDGIIQGIAAFILIANSAASSEDLYNCFKLFSMDPDTLFANFKENGEIRTEYVVPEEK